MARPRGASPELADHSYCTCRSRLPRFYTAPHQSILKGAGRLWTSTSKVLSYKRSRPCPPDPAWLPRRVPGYTLRPPAPGPPDPHAESVIFLDKILLSSCPCSLFNPPLDLLLFLIGQSAVDCISAIELLDSNYARHFMCQRQP